MEKINIEPNLAIGLVIDGNFWQKRALLVQSQLAKELNTKPENIDLDDEPGNWEQGGVFENNHFAIYVEVYKKYNTGWYTFTGLTSHVPNATKIKINNILEKIWESELSHQRK